jgi:ABC-type lipoprotein release transport system permease subunit
VKKENSKYDHLKTALSVGAFLAKRELSRANKWTTGLIIFVMTLTFLNLVVISGILVGLIEGSVEANKKYYTGDVFISPLLEHEYIDNSQDIEKIVRTLPGFVDLTRRYAVSGTVVSNYKETLPKDVKQNQTGALITGIDPEQENDVTGIGDKIIRGEFLEAGDTEYIVIGADILYEFTPIESPSYVTLKNVTVGTKVLLKIGDIEKEVTVKGIIKSKAGDVDARVFMVDNELRKLAGRGDFNVDEMAVMIDSSVTAERFKEMLIDSGVGVNARVQTYEDAQPKFLKDIKATFALLGNVIGSIGLVVASITIFIVIFVNAITRRRYIGILKGIGVSPLAIKYSYVLQSLFYAGCGVLLGGLIVFFGLKPLIQAHPINFPFSDGILVATIPSTLVKAFILFIATIIAGYIPARIVVKQNTLDAILGR